MTHSVQFPEVEQFVEQAIARYSLDPVQISGLGIKDALCQLKHSHPHFKAIMMGTRRTDPYSGTIGVNVLLFRRFLVEKSYKTCNGT